MFTDLLKGQAPLVQHRIGKVIHWGPEDQPIDFTTMENTAEYTAHAALDDESPRYLCVAGDVLDIKGLQKSAGLAYDKKFKRVRMGSLSAFRKMISFTRFVAPQKKEVFPAWQGMQYLHDMLEGKVKFTDLHNNRYEVNFQKVEDVLANK
jgi:hypothetical protein